jgi:2-oxo-3-hexenedioate decarboxylase
MASGDRVAGRKLGFTNRKIWDEYKVSSPIIGPMYGTTIRELGERPFDPSTLLEPRIEPEIAFRLDSIPAPGTPLEEVIACVDGICAGFELVQSIFPGWQFQAADTVAGFGMHGAFLHGPIHDLRPSDRQTWVRQLSGFRTTLWRNDVVADEGEAANVLGGGPLEALRLCVALVAQVDSVTPLAPGELVTTGTLTRALPIGSGETWRAGFDGLPLAPIEITFE